MYPNSSRKQHDNHPVLQFIEENGLEKQAPISQLEKLKSADTDTVGLMIDGVKLLLNFERAIREAEPLSTMTSALPVTAYSEIIKTIELLQRIAQHCESRRIKFKPIIVFNGCGFTPTERPLIPPVAPTDSMLCRTADEKRGIENVVLATAERYIDRFYLEEDIEGCIVRNLHQSLRAGNLGEVMRAPYLCWSQISAMFAPDNDVASDVYGSIELLAFPGVERVITSIDPKTLTFKYVTKADLLHSFKEKRSEVEESDLSAFLLYASRCRDFHILEMNDSFQHMVGHTEREFLQLVGRPEIKELLLRSTAALEAPVLTKTGDVKLLRQLYQMPPKQNIKKYFGKPLPPTMFFLLASGPLIPAPFASVSQFYLLDQWPLVDSRLFRSESEFIVSLRAQTLHHLNLSREGRGDKRLNWQREYNLRTNRTTTIAIPSATNLCQWFVTEEDFPNDTMVYFQSVLKYADRSQHNLRSLRQTHTIPTTLAVILLRTIDLLGYISHRELTMSNLSQIGSCLELFDCPTLSSYGLLFIELLRTQTLNDAPIAMTLQATPILYPPGARFASRLLSIVHINCNGPWKGPIDAEIAAFGTCSRLLSRTLRCLTEAVTTNIFMERATSLPLDVFPLVVEQLPFALPSEFNAGILVMHMILNKSCTLMTLKEDFPQLFTLERDLETLDWFWKKAFAAFNEMLKDNEERPNFKDYEGCFNAANDLIMEAFDRVLGPRPPY